MKKHEKYSPYYLCLIAERLLSIKNPDLILWAVFFAVFGIAIASIHFKKFIVLPWITILLGAMTSLSIVNEYRTVYNDKLKVKKDEIRKELVILPRNSRIKCEKLTWDCKEENKNIDKSNLEIAEKETALNASINTRIQNATVELSFTECLPITGYGVLAIILVGMSYFTIKVDNIEQVQEAKKSGIIFNSEKLHSILVEKVHKKKSMGQLAKEHGMSRTTFGRVLAKSGQKWTMIGQNMDNVVNITEGKKRKNSTSVFLG